ncbi:rh50 isoform b [Anaeramoeba flamelloides]|uniref:Rh50 isoform b n=1 Tax=Anaeramoeba flamelloides TaxID=1746091 RepID=A0AAV7ZLX8_9EUKA|nr:rh50 isoform b [Anaeramoeba flamelloides]
MLKNKPFLVTFLFLEIIFFVIIGIWFRYDTTFDEESSDEYKTITIKLYYRDYTNILVFILVGIALRMSYLKFYSYSGSAFTLLFTVFCFQLTLICNAFFEQANEKNFHSYELTFQSLLGALFGTLAILISFGSIIGSTSLLYLLMVSLFGCILFSVNKYCGMLVFNAIDVGGTMITHLFGSCYGVGITFSSYSKTHYIYEAKQPSKFRDFYSLIGTILMWVFFPSLNSALALPEYRYHSILNTVLSLSGSCGIIIGTVANLNLTPGGAMGIGILAGILSVIGYQFLQPLFENKLEVNDTVGIFSLHLLPSFIGGLIGMIVVSIAKNDHSIYDGRYNLLFPKQDDQIIHQVGCFFLSLTIGIFGGVFVGLFLNWLKIDPNKPYEDTENWKIDKKVLKNEKKQQNYNSNNDNDHENNEYAFNEKGDSFSSSEVNEDGDDDDDDFDKTVSSDTSSTNQKKKRKSKNKNQKKKAKSKNNSQKKKVKSRNKNKKQKKKYTQNQKGNSFSRGGVNEDGDGDDYFDRTVSSDISSNNFVKVSWKNNKRREEGTLSSWSPSSSSPSSESTDNGINSSSSIDF